ncbi:hypothetical protein [Microlunatus soli]|uniref:Uncharacterized protein n=1 Tax=Microlunatus soli TaxID=630515 RepID=A0A1H1TLW5_9ACTN|nr:hypothetical protein [Microlunatus soli]SDS61162.1 hypothetical protein SAMN04489812_2444 [Microlunatus soli]
METGTIRANLANGSSNMLIKELRTVQKLPEASTTARPTIAFQTVMLSNEIFKDKMMRRWVTHAVSRQEKYGFRPCWRWSRKDKYDTGPVDLQHR